jgi:hypothetical protein
VARLKFLDVTDGGLNKLGSYRDLILHSHTSPSMDESMARFLGVLDSGGRQTKKRGSLVIVGSNVRPPSLETRQQLESFLVKWQDTMLAAALLILGNEFSVATHRASGSRLRLSTSATYPQGFFHQAPDAAAWLAKHLPEHTSGEIEIVIAELLAPLPRF